MANTRTQNLELTLATDLNTLFSEWITIINSNNQIIDNEAGNVRTAISSANTQIQNILTSLLDYYTKTEVNDLIGSIARLEIKVVDDISEVDEAGYIYLVPKDTSEEGDTFNEYIYYDGQPELIGSTEISIDALEEINNRIDEVEDSVATETAQRVVVDKEIFTRLDDVNEQIENLDDTLSAQIDLLAESIPDIEANPQEVEDPVRLSNLRINDTYFKLPTGSDGEAISMNYIAYLMSFHNTAIPGDSDLNTLIGETDGEERDLIMVHNNQVNYS